MTLFELLQSDRQLNRGSKAFKNYYDIQTVLVGELETASKRDGKVITDEMVVAVARKLRKSNSETLGLLKEEDSEKAHALLDQNICLERYLPQLMTAEQIRSDLQNRKADVPFKNIGEVMKYMNETHPGKFDKGLASKIAKEIIL